MKLLLDSHVLLWSFDKPDMLSKRAREAILDEANELHASVASMWEIELKVQAGKLTVPSKPDFLEEHLRQVGIQAFLSVSIFHVRHTRQLPPIHKDPFDRILVAQAISEGMTLVSKDEVLRRYDVPVLW